MNPVDKKVFQSRDIIFMEDKTLADWESEKKIINSDEIRTHPAQSQTTLDETACHDHDTEPVAEEAEGAEIGTDQDLESDSDVSEGQRRRYPLRERRDPRRFSDAEHVLLTE